MSRTYLLPPAIEGRFAPSLITRRQFVALGLAASIATTTPALGQRVRVSEEDLAIATEMYGPLPTEPFPVPGVEIERLRPEFYRRLTTASCISSCLRGKPFDMGWGSVDRGSPGPATERFSSNVNGRPGRPPPR